MISFDKDDPRYLVEIGLMRKVIDRVLDTLSAREKKAIELLFLSDNHTVKSIAAYYNITPERVRRIKAKALRKLAHPKRKDILEAAVTGKTLQSIQDYRDGKVAERVKKEREEFEQAREEERQLRIQIHELLMRIRDGDIDEAPPPFLSVVKNSYGNYRLVAPFLIRFTLPPFVYNKWLSAILNNDRRSQTA